MKQLPITMKSILLWSSLLLIQYTQAQCTIIPNAVPDITLTFTVGVNNATGVAFNPNLNLYYIAQAGNPGFPLQTLSVTGVPLFQTNTGFDMRGLWWNPNLNQLESNGYNTGGIWTYNLNGSGYGLNTGTSVFGGMNQPTAQSVGDYNCVDNELWYYDNGNIMKRNRANNALIGVFPITGLPVGIGNLNNNTVFYTDCAGHEIGLLDYVLKRIYFVDKTTMAYTGMSQLPAATVTTNAFKSSWANGKVWLLNGNTWHGFEVLTGFNTNCTVVVCTPPVLITDDLVACAPNTVDLNNGINVGSGVGNATFYNSLADANAGIGAVSSVVGTSGTYYVRLEDVSDPSCFSVDAIVVTINANYALSENDNACQNSNYTFPDGTSQVITANTSYVSNLFSVNGCDSVITTNVTMNLEYNVSVNVNACQNSNYIFPDGTSQVISANTSQSSTLSSVAGCDSIVVTNVTMDLLPSAGTNGSITFCQGGAGSDLFLELGGTPTAGGTWSPALNSGTGFYDPTIDAAGVYTYSVTNPCGTISASVTVTTTPIPDPGTNGSATFCTVDPSYDLFNALGGSPDLGGTWSPAMSSGTGIFNPIVDPSGIYTYQFTTSCGVFSAQINVTVNPSQDASFAYAGGAFCESDPNPTPIITGTPGGIFTINNGGIINSNTGAIDIAGSGPGGYTVTYTTTGSCPDANQYDITILANTDATITPAGPFCMSDFSVYLQAVDPGGIWSGPGVDVNTGEFDPSLANIGMNTITYTTPGACGDMQSIQIEVTGAPTVTTIADTTINAGVTINLTTTGSGGTYYWTPNIWIDCYDCESPDITPEETTLYTVILTENGCSTSTNVLVTVLYDPVIFVPNIFSPNQDGNNDVLFVRGKGIESMTFYVYDRWGEKVFETTDKSIGWDGTLRGKKMNPGVFVYYLEGVYKDGNSFSQKGDVTLIR